MSGGKVGSGIPWFFRGDVSNAYFVNCLREMKGLGPIPQTDPKKPKKEKDRGEQESSESDEG